MRNGRNQGILALDKRLSPKPKDHDMPTNPKIKAVLDRIRGLEEAITIGREYLETGEHADWPGFRPLFARKVRDGKGLPPHRDWVRNVFLPRQEKVLGQARKTLERLIQRRKSKSVSSASRLPECLAQPNAENV
jgi:hypothetical protein